MKLFVCMLFIMLLIPIVSSFSVNFDDYRTRINGYEYNKTITAIWNPRPQIQISNCFLELNNTNYSGIINQHNCEITISGLSEGNYSVIGWINDSEGVINKTETEWVYVFEDLDPSGYWIFRAPVKQEDIQTGDSYPCRYANYSDPVYPYYPCGNGQDTGVLRRQNTPPSQDFEERHCDNWVQFLMDEPNITKGVIDNVYCHIWASNVAYLGFSGNSSDSMYNPSEFLPNTRKYFEDIDAQPDNATYFSLFVYNLTDLNHFLNNYGDFINLSIKLGGPAIQVLSAGNQKSFCIFNRIGDAKLEDENHLSMQDTDNDGLDDWDELWTTYTDPFDKDTDNDGFDDGFEFEKGKKGYDPYDWGNTKKYFANETNFTITWKTVNNAWNIDFEPVTSELPHSLSQEEYGLLSNFDGGVPDLSLETFTLGFSTKKTLAQINFKIKINEKISEISNINIFYGGRNRAIASGKDYDFSNIIYNNTGEHIYFCGRYQPTYARYFKQFKNGFEDIIDEEGHIYYRWATITQGSPVTQALTQLDWAEVWVTTKEDYSFDGCGDLNSDSKIDILDILYFIDYKYKKGPSPLCDPETSCADLNSDGVLNILDILYLIDYKFKNGPKPVCSTKTINKQKVQKNDWTINELNNYLVDAIKKNH